MNTITPSILNQLACRGKQLLMVALLAAVCVLSMPLSAQQTDWVQIANDQNNELRISVDPSRITRIPEGYVRTWTRWNYSQTQTTLDGASYTQAMLHQDIDCANQRTRVISAVAYNQAGAMVGREGGGSWNSVVPESVGDQMVKELCAYAAQATTAPAAAPTSRASTRAVEPQEPSGITLCEALNGTSLIAEDGTFLGTIENRYASESVLNEYGTYGSPYNTNSIWNKYGQYGGEYSTNSPFNRFTTTPPQIVYNGEVLGYLTVNQFLQNAVNPGVLRTCRF